MKILVEGFACTVQCEDTDETPLGVGWLEFTVMAQGRTLLFDYSFTRTAKNTEIVVDLSRQTIVVFDITDDTVVFQTTLKEIDHALKAMGWLEEAQASLASSEDTCYAIPV